MRPQLRDVRPAWSRNRRSNRRRKPRRRRLPLLPTPVPPKSLPKSRRGARPGRAKSLRAAFASRRTPTVRGSPHEPFIQPSFAQAAASGCDGPSRRSAWRASPIPRGRRDLFGTFGDAGSAAILPPPGPYPAGPYSQPPGAGGCPQCGTPAFSGGPQGAAPAALDAPGAASLPSTWTSPAPKPAVRARSQPAAWAASGLELRAGQFNNRSVQFRGSEHAFHVRALEHSAFGMDQCTNMELVARTRRRSAALLVGPRPRPSMKERKGVKR